MKVFFILSLFCLSAAFAEVNNPDCEDVIKQIFNGGKSFTEKQNLTSFTSKNLAKELTAIQKKISSVEREIIGVDQLMANCDDKKCLGQVDEKKMKLIAKKSDIIINCPVCQNFRKETLGEVASIAERSKLYTSYSNQKQQVLVTSGDKYLNEESLLQAFHLGTKYGIDHLLLTKNCKIKSASLLELDEKKEKRVSIDLTPELCKKQPKRECIALEKFWASDRDEVRSMTPIFSGSTPQ